MRIVLLLLSVLLLCCCVSCHSTSSVTGAKPKLAFIKGMCDQTHIDAGYATGTLLQALTSNDRVAITIVEESDIDTLDKLNVFDVVFLGSSISPSIDLSATTTGLLRQYVEGGGGLFTVASVQSSVYAGRTELQKVLPVIMEDETMFCRYSGFGQGGLPVYPMDLTVNTSVSHEITATAPYTSAMSSTSVYLSTAGVHPEGRVLAYFVPEVEPACEIVDSTGGETLTSAIAAQGLVVREVGLGRSVYLGLPICSQSVFIGSIQNNLVNGLISNLINQAVWWAAKPCATMKCNSSHGQCSAIESCSCDYGWTGSADCSQFVCAPACDSTHGQCVGVNTCNCTTNFDPLSQCASCISGFKGTDCTTAIPTSDIQDGDFEQTPSKWSLSGAIIVTDDKFNATQSLSNSASGNSTAYQEINLYFPNVLSGAVVFPFHAKGSGKVYACISKNDISNLIDCQVFNVNSSWVEYRPRLTSNLDSGAFNFTLILEASSSKAVFVDLVQRLYVYCYPTCKNSGYCIDSDKCSCPTGYAQPACETTICGDSLIIDSEQCDDGNGNPGDGCSGTCQIESGFVCNTTVVPSSCHNVCGNMIASWPYEECDDGGTVGGDGCSADCKIEVGYACTSKNVTCKPICGDSLVVGDEFCDNGNTTGCWNCVIQQGYNCTLDSANKSTCVSVCGDGLFDPLKEECDTGGDSEGCVACKVQLGYACTNPNGWKYVSVCGPVCGNSMVNGSETCDDGNTVAGDGCSSFCKTETYWKCETPGSSCVTKDVPYVSKPNVTISAPVCSGNTTTKSTGGAVFASSNYSPAGGDIMFYLEKSGSSVSSSAGVFTSVAPGTYTVRVVITLVSTGSTAENSTDNVVVPNGPTTIKAVATSSTTVGCSSSDGSVTITVSNLASVQGPVIYYLSGKSQSSNVFDNLAAAYYSPAVVDSNGCYLSLGKIAVTYPTDCSSSWFNLWSRGGTEGVIILAIVIAFVILCLIIASRVKKSKEKKAEKNFVASMAGIPDEDLMPRRKDDFSTM
eukprot:TRINITY_DN17163_c0_g1_i1.p1 TRINITY_DN17163_c0_g1~~TRINITY_DN17163_c0_g1_i1.p1  ORF type:complete len:1018 (-),score=220.48 TRINITY_DN17163_c0_g1_i1:68-3121(-)